MCSCSIAFRSEWSSDGGVSLLLQLAGGSGEGFRCSNSSVLSSKNCSCAFLLSSSLLFATKLEYLQCKQRISRSNLSFAWQPMQLALLGLSVGSVGGEVRRSTMRLHV